MLYKTFRHRPRPGLQFHSMRQMILILLCSYNIYLQIFKYSVENSQAALLQAYNDHDSSTDGPDASPIPFSKFSHFSLLSYNRHIFRNKPSPNFRHSNFLISKSSSWLSIILLLSGDLEVNPGPGRTPKYPCGICSKACTWKTPSVACDSCDVWYHTSCMMMNTTVYNGLHNVSWHCFRFGIQNFSSSLSSSTSLDHSDSSINSPKNSPNKNSFQPLLSSTPD